MSQYGAITPSALIEQEVIVVAEPVTNSLIVSATPRYFQDIKKIIDRTRRAAADGADPGAYRPGHAER